MKSWLLLFLVLTLPAAAGMGDNLLPNPDFAKGLAHWKVTFPEANETKYADNDKLVSVLEDPTGGKGKVMKFDVPKPVAEDMGVKACTELIKVDPNGAYEFGCDTYSTGCSVILFLEGYQEDPTRMDPAKDQGDNQYLGLVRRYRRDLFVKTGPGQWGTQAIVANFAKLLPKSRPTWVLIKCYAFYPQGTVYFRHVFLRQVPVPAGTKVQQNEADATGLKHPEPTTIPTISPPAGKPTAGPPPAGAR